MGCWLQLDVFVQIQKSENFPCALWVMRQDQTGRECHLGLSSARLRVPCVRSLSLPSNTDVSGREPLGLPAPSASFKSLLMIVKSNT